MSIVFLQPIPELKGQKAIDFIAKANLAITKKISLNERE